MWSILKPCVGPCLPRRRKRFLGLVIAISGMFCILSLKVHYDETANRSKHTRELHLHDQESLPEEKPDSVPSGRPSPTIVAVDEIEPHQDYNQIASSEKSQYKIHQDSYVDDDGNRRKGENEREQKRRKDNLVKKESLPIEKVPAKNSEQEKKVVYNAQGMPVIVDGIYWSPEVEKLVPPGEQKNYYCISTNKNYDNSLGDNGGSYSITIISWTVIQFLFTYYRNHVAGFFVQ